MRAAVASWQGRVAPVFDTARQIRLVDLQAGGIAGWTEVVLASERSIDRVLRLVELGVGTLVCGAISRPLHEQIAAYGIAVIPFVAGDLDEVVQALRDGELQSGAFAMPGCRRRRRQGRGRGRGRRCQAETEKDPGDRER